LVEPALSLPALLPRALLLLLVFVRASLVSEPAEQRLAASA
jgi:hypothetical protein